MTANLPWTAHPRRGCVDATYDELFGPVALQRELAAVLCDGCPCLEPCREQARKEPWGLWGGIPEGGDGRPRRARERNEVPA